MDEQRGEPLKEELSKDMLGVFRLSSDGKSIIIRQRDIWIRDISRGINTRAFDPGGKTYVGLTELSRGGYVVIPSFNNG